MISKLTKSAVLAILTLTLSAALPQLLRAQETDKLSVPTGQPTINWNITLSGPPFRGMTPVGAAEYEVEGSRRRSPPKPTMSTWLTGAVSMFMLPENW